MSSIYELTGQWIMLQDMAEDCDAETFADTLETLDYEIEEKADGYAKVIKHLELDCDGIDKEIKRLTEKKNSIKNNIARMKKNLQECMVTTGKTKFKTELFSFGIQKNGGKAPLIVDYCPDEFLFYPDPEPDKDKIRELLDSGAECTWARYGERGESLRIR